jgi:two-component system response regulator FixJ
VLGTAGFETRPFAGGGDFVEAVETLAPGVVLLDVRMPAPDGFQVMEELARRRIDWPVIVMTGHGDVPVAVRAMKLGAVDFLEKPFDDETLLAALDRAFGLLKDRGDKAERRRAAEERIGQLTAREHEVLRGLMAGFPNKLLARELNISLRTVEMHRANMMERLKVASLAEALTLAVLAEIEPMEQGGD